MEANGVVVGEGAQRRVSGIPFPYYNLAQSAEVARKIYVDAGGECERAQLAAMLGYKGVKNGSFLTRVTAAKMFGFIEQDGAMLRVTQRGRSVAAPITEADAEQAKVDAFLDVPLFRRVFEEFNGQPLPGENGLRNLLTKLEVVKDRVAPTVTIMMDSAEQAGFFKTPGNRSRMVMPFMTGARNAAKQHPAAPHSEPHKDSHARPSTPGSESGERSPAIHAAILGLLRELPPAGTRLTAKKRAALIAAFTATVGWIYPDPDDEAPH